MSFSTDVKEELSKLSNLANKDWVKAELYGYLNSNNVSEENGFVKFSTESEYNINRFSKLLSNLDIYKYDINIIGKIFYITIPKKESEKLEKIYVNYNIENVESIEKAFVRGTFLGSGSINNPENKYHIEITLKSDRIAQIETKILKKYNVNFKVLGAKEREDRRPEYAGQDVDITKDINLMKQITNKKKSLEDNEGDKCAIYSKDGEEISKFLAFIEASSSMLKFEEIRVYRDMRNNVNRIVNCETANLSKTVNAAVRQIEAINKLKKEGRFNSLPDNLKEIANLRLENPEASLTELGTMLKEPIGKSGVNYRLKSLIDLAK